MSGSLANNGIGNEYLGELDIAGRQTVAVADAIPAERYAWRPAIDARSVSEVLVHVAAGNFFLLAHVGVPLPLDIYPSVPLGGPERVSAIIRINDGMERSTTDKAVILVMLRRSFELACAAASAASDEELTRHLDEATTVRRVYFRLLSHAHEHMGQVIAYLRANGIRAPWPDWRPDRRPQT